MSARQVRARHRSAIPDAVTDWLDRVAEPVVVLSKATAGLRLVHANSAFCLAVGVGRDELLARGPAAWLADETLRRLRRAVDVALRKATARCRELDASGTIAELRRIRWRGRALCVATLRLPQGAAVAPLSRGELAHRADLLRTAMDLEAMAAWSWNRRQDRIRVEYRAAAADFLRFGAPSMASLIAMIHRNDRQRVQAVVRQALSRDGIHHAEFRITGTDGRERWTSSAMQRFVDARGRPAGLVGATRDITRRKDFYRELAESEARLRTVLETEPECVTIVDGRGLLQMMNRAGLAMIEADTAAQPIGRPAAGLVAPEHRAAFEAFHQRVMAGGTELLEFEIVGLKGTRRWMESRAAPLRDAAGEIVGQLAVTRDVTERRRLSREIIEAASREQERIGHDLHDGLGQELTGIALMLKGLQGRLGRPRRELEQDVGEILGLVSRALQSTRSIARGLSPVALERGGLIEALRLLVRNARETARPQLRLAIRSSMKEYLDLPVRLHLYRIAQEALSNALRHADARRITVGLVKSRHRVRLRIADDGKGLPAGAPEGSGLGQHTMKYRAQLIGASIRFVSPASGGTAVIVEWPAGPAGKRAP